MSEFEFTPTQYSVDELFQARDTVDRSPITELLALNTAWVAVSNRIMANHPSADEVAPELRTFILEVVTLAEQLAAKLAAV